MDTSNMNNFRVNPSIQQGGAQTIQQSIHTQDNTR